MTYVSRKVSCVTLLSILTYMVLCFVAVEAVFARAQAIERSEDELLIFETYVNDKQRSSGVLAYLPEGANITQTLFPVSSVSRILSFSLQSDPVNGKIDGWFYNENNVLQVDVERNTVFVNGVESLIPKGAVEVHYDDIYVRADILSEWLGIQFRPDMSMLKLYVTSEKPLPFEEEEDRKNKAKAMAGGYGKNARDFAADKLLPYQWWSKPSIVLQQGVQGRSAQGEKSMNANFSMQSSFDAMRFGTKFLLSGTTGTESDTKINTSTLTFERRDPGNGLLGALKAGRVSFGDVNYPDVPLVIGRKRGRGISVASDSRYGNSRSSSSEKLDIDGDAPIGWDAELYRNGYYVAFQDVGADGRYNFEDVELVRGFNLIKIILYGPEGQQRTETQRIIRGQDVLREGEIDYEFTVGQPESDFIPLAENARTSSAFGGSGQVGYGVREYLTVGANVYSGGDSSSLNDERQTSAGVSVVAAVAGVKTGVQATAANEGRSAYGVDVTTQVKGANITAAHTVYDGFHEDDKDLTKATALNVHRNFGRLSLSGGVEKNSYQKKEDELHVSANISTHIGRVQFTNSLDRVYSDNQAQEEFRGELSAVSGIADWRLRANMGYNLEKGVQDKLRNASLSAYKKIGRHSTLRLGGDYTFSSNLVSADARYTRDFDRYSIDFNVGGTNDSSYYGGVTLRTALQPDDAGKYHIVSARDGGLGSVGLRTYVDVNENGIFDKGEHLIKGVSFRSNRGALDGQTADDGTLFINGLPEGPTIFYLQEASLSSIYLKPVNEAIEIIPRAGATATIDVPFAQLGEIDGFTMALGADDEALAGVIVVLYDAETGEEVSSMNSEYDGYYIFSALPMGEYRVEAVPIWNESESYPSISVHLSYEEPIVTDVNLSVSSLRRAPMDEVLAVSDAASNAPEQSSGIYIHLGSMSSIEGAEGAQQKLWAEHEELSDVLPGIYNVKVNGTDYYRVLGVVSSRVEGQNLCDVMMVRKPIDGGCVVLEM
ncbi:MAG: MSCRAMM family protein [Alphaproteobacteria bacterium]